MLLLWIFPKAFLAILGKELPENSDTSDKNSNTFWEITLKLQFLGWEKHEKTDTFLVQKSASRYFEKKMLLGPKAGQFGTFSEISTWLTWSTVPKTNLRTMVFEFLS